MADAITAYSSPSPSSNRRSHSFHKNASSLDLAKEEIICPMCIGVFHMPRSLQCLHSYCESCIESLLRSSTDKTTICCPECRAETAAPSEGVEGFPINFKLKRFVELLSQEEKRVILTRSISMKQAKRPVLSPTEQQQSLKSATCALHKGKELEYYCEECGLLVCGKCMLEKHRLHEGVQYASDTLSEHIAGMLADLASVSATVSTSKTILDSLRSNMIELKEAGEETATQVKDYFDSIHQLLREREAAILEELGKDVNRRERILLKHQNGIQEATSELQKCIEAVEDIKENRADDMLVLQEEKSIRSQVEESKNQLEMIIANVKVKGRQTFKSSFHADSYFVAQCKTVGENPYVRPCDDDPKPAAAGYAAEQYDHVPPLPPSSRPRTRIMSQPQLIPSLSSESINSIPSTACSVHSRTNSLTTGYDRRSGSYDNDDLLMPDMVLPPYLEITAKQLLGSSPKMAMVYPNGVCLGKPESLIVTDSRNGILRILTPTGKCLESVVIESKGDGNMVEPTAVTTNEEGFIFLIIKGSSSKIQKYSPSGKFLMKVKARGHLGDPTGITVLPNGNMLITDAQKTCVHVIDGAGKYQGKLDIAEAHLPENPSDITHDHRGNLIIADRGNHCIWIYSSNGRYVNCFGRQGPNPGELLHPYSVAVDLDGFIYVAESGNHRISVFTLNGKFVRCFGKKGSEPGMFHYPRHLCVDSQGRLVVADDQNQRLQIFDTRAVVGGVV